MKKRKAPLQESESYNPLSSVLSSEKCDEQGLVIGRGQKRRVADRRGCVKSLQLSKCFWLLRASCYWHHRRPIPDANKDVISLPLWKTPPGTKVRKWVQRTFWRHAYYVVFIYITCSDRSVCQSCSGWNEWHYYFFLQLVTLYVGSFVLP